MILKIVVIGFRKKDDEMPLENHSNNTGGPVVYENAAFEHTEPPE